MRETGSQGGRPLRRPAALMVLFLLAACASPPPDPVAESARAFQATETAYVAALQQATLFNRACEARPIEAKAGCTGAVMHVRALIDGIFPLFESAQAAVAAERDASAEVEAFAASLRTLQDYLGQRPLPAGTV